MMRSIGCSLAVLGLLSVPTLSRAETFAGIEIGAKGVKFTIVDAKSTPEGLEFRVTGSGSENATLVAGLAKDGKFAADGLREAGAIVKKFHEEIKSKYQVRPVNIFLVGSSGITSPIESKPDAVKEAQTILAKSMADASGLKMDFIDVRREAELSIKGMVPHVFRDESLLVDIGSGNAKGGFLDGDKFITFGVPFGTTSFATMAAGLSGSLPDKFEELKKSKLVPALKKELGSSANFNKKNRIYLSGGIVYAVTTLTDFSKKKPYHPITLEQITQLETRMLKDPSAFPMPDLSSIRDAESKASVLKEIERVKGIYKPDQLMAGVEILKTILTELEADKKSLFWVREGQIGWISAYVAEKVK
jgi:exopolyphosphatase/pppGpp-phosphohydrolase